MFFALFSFILYSNFYGEKKAFPAKASDKGNDFGIQDYLLICVKNYILDSIVIQYLHVWEKKHIIVPHNEWN